MLPCQWLSFTNIHITAVFPSLARLHRFATVSAEVHGKSGMKAIERRKLLVVPQNHQRQKEEKRFDALH